LHHTSNLFKSNIFVPVSYPNCGVISGTHKLLVCSLNALKNTNVRTKDMLSRESDQNCPKLLNFAITFPAVPKQLIHVGTLIGHHPEEGDITTSAPIGQVVGAIW
jgi:hypothetical protein